MQSAKIRMKSLYRRVQNVFERLRHHEAHAMRVHMDDLRERATVAVQAGDFNTLVSDQIDLMPRSNESLRAHWLGLMAIARQNVLEWMGLGRDYWQAIKSVVKIG